MSGSIVPSGYITLGLSGYWQRPYGYNSGDPVSYRSGGADDYWYAGSGAILSGQIGYGGGLPSGALVSGSASWPRPVEQTCCVCGRGLGEGMLRQGVHVYNTSGGAGMNSQHWCWGCAGYRDYEEFGWQREVFIRETFPQMATAPPGMLYDWLIEQNQDKNAEYLAARYSGCLDSAVYRDPTSKEK